MLRQQIKKQYLLKILHKNSLIALLLIKDALAVWAQVQLKLKQLNQHLALLDLEKL